MLNPIDYYRKKECSNCENDFFQRESLLADYCNYCGPFVVENETKKLRKIKTFSDYSREKLEFENRRLEKDNLNLKKEILELENSLENERNTNLEALENLKVLNEEKLTKNLEIRNKEIDNLNYKIDQLAEKLNCLIEQK